MVFSCPNDKRSRDIVPIAGSLLDGMAGRQPFAGLVKSEAGEEAWLFCIGPDLPIDAILGKDGLNLIPKGLVDNGGVLSGIGIAFVGDLTAIDAVLQHEIESAAGELLAATSCSIC